MLKTTIAYLITNQPLWRQGSEKPKRSVSILIDSVQVLCLASCRYWCEQACSGGTSDTSRGWWPVIVVGRTDSIYRAFVLRLPKEVEKHSSRWRWRMS
jgi:hypothetical protein